MPFPFYKLSPQSCKYLHMCLILSMSHRSGITWASQCDLPKQLIFFKYLFLSFFLTLYYFNKLSPKPKATDAKGGLFMDFNRLKPLKPIQYFIATSTTRHPVLLKELPCLNILSKLLQLPIMTPIRRSISLSSITGNFVTDYTQKTILNIFYRLNVPDFTAGKECP